MFPQDPGFSSVTQLTICSLGYCELSGSRDPDHCIKERMWINNLGEMRTLEIPLSLPDRQNLYQFFLQK